MRKVFVLILFIPLTLCVFAQNNLPPVFEIANDTADYTELDNTFWQVLEDRERKLTLEQVTTSSVDNNFHFDSSKVKGVDNSLHVYWFRIRLKNTMMKEAKIVFFNE